MKKGLIAITLAAAAAGLPLLAGAQQFAKTEDAIKYRQSALFMMSQHTGLIGAMVNDKIPFDAAQAKASADIIQVIGTLPWQGFVPGSDKGPTKARPEVWTDPGKFNAAKDRLLGVLPKLAAAAGTGDKAQLRQAFGETGAACKNCHDDFRAR